MQCDIGLALLLKNNMETSTITTTAACFTCMHVSASLPSDSHDSSLAKTQLTLTTFPLRGSMTRMSLSFDVVANREPSRFHARLKIVSVCTEMMLMGSAVSVFHKIHCKSKRVQLIGNRFVAGFFEHLFFCLSF